MVSCARNQRNSRYKNVCRSVEFKEWDWIGCAGGLGKFRSKHSGQSRVSNCTKVTADYVETRYAVVVHSNLSELAIFSHPSFLDFLQEDEHDRHRTTTSISRSK